MWGGVAGSILAPLALRFHEAAPFRAPSHPRDQEEGREAGNCPFGRKKAELRGVCSRVKIDLGMTGGEKGGHNKTERNNARPDDSRERHVTITARAPTPGRDAQVEMRINEGGELMELKAHAGLHPAMERPVRRRRLSALRC